MKPLQLFTVTALAVFAVPASARGPSFNCAKASAADEKAICRSSRLSALDDLLGREYRTVLGCLMMGSRDAERDYQNEWLQRRAACGGNTACIGRLYRKRLAELKPRASKARNLMAQEMCPGPV